MNDYTRGFLLTFFGVLIITPDAVLIRLIDHSALTIAVWRGLGFFLIQMLIIIWIYKKETVGKIAATGWSGFCVAACISGSSFFFVVSIEHTVAANTLVIIMAAPLMAAIFSRVFLKEKIALRIWLASVIAFLVIALISIKDLSAGDVWGNLAAVICMICIAASVTLIRSKPKTDFLPAVAFGGLGTAAFGLLFAETYLIDSSKWGYLAILCLIVSPLGFAFISQAPRYLPAPEVSLLLLLETILGALWVWIWVREAPPLVTFLGGSVLIVALIVNSALALSEQPQPAGSGQAEKKT